ncbi:hypothetical protein [Aeromonas sp. s5]|uniref:hypothetical protein n=1 Tax=Aeromonas sp. s5 TaxID=3138487 RepID=UPI0034A2B101
MRSAVLTGDDLEFIETLPIADIEQAAFELRDIIGLLEEHSSYKPSEQELAHVSSMKVDNDRHAAEIVTARQRKCL